MKAVHFYTSKALEWLVVMILAIMSCLVFVNVVLRYGFNSSINVTEEVSRYLFVWLTFLGAVLAFSDNQHVSVAILTDKLSPKKRTLLKLFTDAAILYCCYLIVQGSWVQFQLNIHNLSPISEIPTGVSYLASVVAGGLMGILVLARLVSGVAMLAKGECQ